jgi:GntR family transcriptional repressor for pyruvate dehydrogenase complex
MQPIERRSVIDTAVEQLRAHILSGEIPVGAKFLTEKEIGEQLSIGRSTVREALRLLEAAGFIEIKPGRGAFVVRTDDDDVGPLSAWFAKHATEVADYVEVRMAIEPLAARAMIDRGRADEIAMIEATHDEFLAAARDQDAVRLARLDERFHELIVRATHNILLIRIMELISVTYFEFRLKSFSYKQNIDHAVQFHGELLTAIQLRDAARAEDAMQRHLRCSFEDIVVSDSSTTTRAF